MQEHEVPFELIELTDLELGRWEKFANFSDTPNLGNKISFHAYSFRQAAEALVTTWKERNSRTLDFPIAYLCRHYIELGLKSLWEEARTIGYEPTTPPLVHNLLEIWRPVREFLQGVNILHQDDDYLRRFEEIIEFLNSIDDRSVAFRYPLTDRKLHIVIDVPRLWGAVEICETVFFGLNTEIDQYSWHLSDMLQNLRDT